MKKSMRIWAALLCLAMVFSITAFGPGTTAEAASPTKISVNHLNSIDHAYGQGGNAFCEVINTESDGKYEATQFPNGQLCQGNWSVLYELVQTGSLQVGIEGMTSVSTLNPEMSILNLPFLFESEEHMMRFIESNPSVWQKWIKELADNANIVVLAVSSRPPRQISSSQHFIKTPEDIKDMKIRVPNIALYTRIFEALGAKPVPLAGSETYSALQLGTVFGEDNSVQLQYDTKSSEIAKYFTVWNYIHDLDVLFMNKDFFDAASPEDQALFYKAGEAWREAADATNVTYYDVAKNAMEESGVQFYFMSEEEKAPFKELLKPLYEEIEKEYDPEVWNEVMSAVEATR